MQGVRLGQRVVFVDAMQVGLIGQVRRRWTARGVKGRWRVSRRYVWRYLQGAVDLWTGQVWWRWSARVRREDTWAALLAWRAAVWDNAGCHRARWVRAVGVGLVFLPAYSPELTPVARVCGEARRCVEGVVYGAIEAKVAAVESALEGLSGHMVRLVGWDWIREALDELPSG